MQEASIERLSKILDRSTRGGDKKAPQPRKALPPFRLGLAEGWFSLFLLLVIMYTTIWCVQAAGWVEHMEVLSLTGGLGLLIGVLTAKQRRLPSIAVHCMVIVFALLLTMWQTAGAFYNGSVPRVIVNMRAWIDLAFNGGTNTDDATFLFLIAALIFLMAYSSAWLVYRFRLPWIMIFANATILLINLSFIPSGYVVFLIVFLVASLLLVLRFHLYDSLQHWRNQRLRFSDDLGWDFMQAGALISLGIVIFSWVMPWGYINEDMAQIWNTGTWQAVIDNFNRVVAINGGVSAANHGSFRDTLTLGGNPNLTQEIVFRVKTDDGSQYLNSLSYDAYDGRTWRISPTSSQVIKKDTILPAVTNVAHQIKQTVNVVNPPNEQNPYILGSPQISSLGQDAQVLSLNATGESISWVRTNGPMAAGNIYTVTSYVSSADEKSLQAVPMPADSPKFPSNFEGALPISYYDPNVVRTYTQLPKNLDPNIGLLTKQVTANRNTMYAKTIALEAYLRSHYAYNVNINLPAGEEGVSWFLFRSGHQGYCNYFASSMVVMARELGIPARVVIGYTHGTQDPQKHDWVIRGADAHAWVQIYFGGYGWINFEPSASFSDFSRPQPNQFGTASGTNSSSTGGSAAAPQARRINRGLDQPESASNATTGANHSQVSPVGIAGTFLGWLLLLALIGLVVFALWWSRLFRGQRLSARIYGRICLLSEWVGLRPARSQTPYESLQDLAQVSKSQAVSLERFGDIYVRELWADPESLEHPRKTGEIDELPGLWQRMQTGLFKDLARHPSFLLDFPRKGIKNIHSWWSSLKPSRRSTQDLREESLDDRE